MHLKRSLTIVIASALLMLAGCAHTTQIIRASSDAEKLTADIHLAMARGDWQSIYQSGDQELRNTMTEEKFVAMLIAMRETFGAPISSKQTTWKLNTTDKGMILSADCETTFSKNALVKESLQWKKSESGYKLTEYRVDSAKRIKE